MLYFFNHFVICFNAVILRISMKLVSTEEEVPLRAVATIEDTKVMSLVIWEYGGSNDIKSSLCYICVGFLRLILMRYILTSVYFLTKSE